MRADHRPYWLYILMHRFSETMVRHFLAPQFDSFGPQFQIIGCRYIRVNGEDIHIGNSPMMVAERAGLIQLTTMKLRDSRGRIEIGDYALLTPAVRISSALSIKIGDNCMLARGTSISDADWHGIYDRINPIGQSAEVVIGDNVWLCEGVMVCKGVRIGDNSIIGAGSVVTGEIPSNCIAAGVPAKVLRELDPEQGFHTRAELYGDPGTMRWFHAMERQARREQGLWRWLRSSIAPGSSD